MKRLFSGNRVEFELRSEATIVPIDGQGIALMVRLSIFDSIGTMTRGMSLNHGVMPQRTNPNSPLFQAREDRYHR
jgi:hypothetical protein